MKKAKEVTKRMLENNYAEIEKQIEAQLKCFCKAEAEDLKETPYTSVYIPQEIWDDPDVEKKEVSKKGKPILYPEVIRTLNKKGYSITFIGFFEYRGQKKAEIFLEVKNRIFFFQYIQKWIKWKISH